MAKRKSIDDPRPPRHDELVAEILDNSERIADNVRQSGKWPGLPEKYSMVVERPCGHGFIDICMSWRVAVCPEHNSTGDRGLIIEVKSELEHWSAGDVIRQLKGYRRHIDYSGDQWSNACSVKPCKAHYGWALCLFSGRDLSEAERRLLHHERVTIISRRLWQPADEPEMIIAQSEPTDS